MLIEPDVIARHLDDMGGVEADLAEHLGHCGRTRHGPVLQVHSLTCRRCDLRACPHEEPRLPAMSGDMCPPIALPRTERVFAFFSMWW